jgi:peptide/nickel transport system substrate-binding protein
MAHPNSLWRLAILAVVFVTSCAPSTPPATTNQIGSSAVPTSAPVPTGPTRVTIGINSEVKNLASKLDTVAVTTAGNLRFLSNAPLVVLDAQGRAQPRLAAQLPSRDQGTWVVNPDGSMVTTWSIRPNAVWHDGTPVTAGDFEFAWRVYLDPALAVNERDPERRIERVEIVDPKTFKLYWRQPYPWANELVLGQLEALPVHVLGSLYEAGDSSAFENAPFWTSTDYVGVGPYRLVDWVKGSQLTYRAFDQYFLGRPRIDEVVVRIGNDPNAVVATVMAGAVDLTVGFALGQQGAAEVKKRWDVSQEGHIASTPTHTRYVNLQQDPAKAGNPALRDVRVRQALVQAIDRVSIAEVVTAGAATAADVLVSPNDPLFPRVLQAITKYPFDVTRSQALLQEAGWTRRGDALVDASGQAFQLDIRTTATTADNVTQRDLIASSLSALGMQTSQSDARIGATDREFNVQFTGLNAILTPIDVPRGLASFTMEMCPRPENRWTGSNSGCWNNSSYERLIGVATTSLEESARADATIQALKVMSDDVGVFAMSYNTENIPIRKGLTGPGPRWSAQGGTTWNVHEWSW